MPLGRLAAAALCMLAVADLAFGNELVSAVRGGELAEVERLLDGGADVDAAEADGATALHWAVHGADREAARRLLEAGADASHANSIGATPLFLASINGDAAMIELLLEHGADPNETFRNGETALMFAARTGDVAAIDALVEHGADVDAVEALRGTTALMWAAANANPPAVAALIRHGADVGKRSADIERGRGPYLAPTAQSRIEGFLRGTGQAGRSIPVEGEGGSEAEIEVTPVSGVPFLTEERIADVRDTARASAGSADDDDDDPFRRSRPRDWGGLTPLVFAAREGDLESTRILLEAGADVNQTTTYGWTALLTATQNRYYRLGELLLGYGADPAVANKGGWSPLYIATDNRNIEGGDYPTRKPDMDHFEYIELLIAHGADVDARMASSTETRTIFTHQWLREEGATPFLRAAQSGDLELMRLLLEHGADPSIATTNGTTPLMVASGIGWVEGVTYEWSPEQTREVVALLLELGADVDAQDRDGRTALMGAAHKGRPEIVRMLYEAGADLDIRDFGSRDSIHLLYGTRWRAIDYADGLVRVGVQSAIVQPETAALLRELMTEEGLDVPPAGRTLDSICVVDICK